MTKSFLAWLGVKQYLTRFYLIVAFLITCLIIHGCRKEIRVGGFQDATLSTDELNTLKDIYAKGIVTGSGFITQSINTPQPKIIRGNSVKWDQYVVNNRDDNSQVMEFDMQADPG